MKPEKTDPGGVGHPDTATPIPDRNPGTPKVGVGQDAPEASSVPEEPKPGVPILGTPLIGAPQPTPNGELVLPDGKLDILHQEGEAFLRTFPETPFAEAARSLEQLRKLNDILVDYVAKSSCLTPRVLRIIQIIQKNNIHASERWMLLTQTYIKMGYSKRSTSGRRNAA